jgi:hypothetical protein
MRWRASLATVSLTSALAIASLYPAFGQRSPQSILPPGFGEPDTPAEKGQPKQPPPRSAPSDKGPSERPPLRTTEPEIGEIPLNIPSRPPVSRAITPADVESALENASVALAEPVTEAQPEIRRALEGVGPLAEGDGGLAPNAWGSSDGRFLNGVINRMRAPVASRWMSITLRRALLSRTRTPSNIAPADWVAARAWLLVRMGEADNARALVDGVDPGNYTPWLSTVAMQAALATADPSALCGIASAAAREDKGGSWILARAMCSGLSGEGGTASALVDQARDSKKARGVDILLVQKVMGVGSNARRSTTVLWDDVQKLNIWRFGLATATGVAIPERLMATAGPQVRAWQARAPLMTPAARAASADWAATLGVFSNAALVDLYASIYDDSDPSERSGTTADTLRAAYIGSPEARVAAFKALLDGSDDNRLRRYARLILGARASAMITPDAGASVADDLVASMMTAGLDIQAARWADTVSSGGLGWALLAVDAPRAKAQTGASAVNSFGTSGGGELKRQFLFAGLAGLGRIAQADIESLARDLEVPIGRTTAWTQALTQAVAANETATVVLLCAAGMQTYDWRDVPPSQLFHIIAALRAVGLEPEARMIAAEALTRA